MINTTFLRAYESVEEAMKDGWNVFYVANAKHEIFYVLAKQHSNKSITIFEIKENQDAKTTFPMVGGGVVGHEFTENGIKSLIQGCGEITHVGNVTDTYEAA